MRTRVQTLSDHRFAIECPFLFCLTQTRTIMFEQTGNHQRTIGRSARDQNWSWRISSIVFQRMKASLSLVLFTDEPRKTMSIRIVFKSRQRKRLILNEPFVKWSPVDLTLSLSRPWFCFHSNNWSSQMITTKRFWTYLITFSYFPYFSFCLKQVSFWNRNGWQQNNRLLWKIVIQYGLNRHRENLDNRRIFTVFFISNMSTSSSCFSFAVFNLVNTFITEWIKLSIDTETVNTFSEKYTLNNWDFKSEERRCLYDKIWEQKNSWDFRRTASHQIWCSGCSWEWEFSI